MELLVLGKFPMERKVGGGVGGMLNPSGPSSSPLDFVLLLLPIFPYCFSFLIWDGNLRCLSL